MQETLPPAPSVKSVAFTLLADAARRNERWVSAARMIFCAATLLRSVTLVRQVDLSLPGEVWFGPPSQILIIAFSFWVIRRSRRGPMPRWIFGASVFVDAAGAFIALLPNALWPYPGYEGVLANIDSAAILLMLTISGFRLLPTVAWLSLLLNALAVAVLVVVDHRSMPLPDAGEVILVTIFAGACFAVSLAFAMQTRRLVFAAAAEAVRAQRARLGLGSLLQDHHDVRSLLSSANLNAELLLRELDEEAACRPRAAQVHEDLLQVSSFVLGVKERAFQELSSFDGPSPVSLATAVKAAAAVVRRRFADVSVSVELDDRAVLVAGGALALQRVMLNLLVNAAEGDGEKAARHILVRCQPLAGDDSRVLISVDDDGPGFSDRVQIGLSSKAEGSGLGLFLVSSLLRASGASLELGRSARLGGAQVAFVLAATP